MLITVYFLINAFESFLLAAYLIFVESSSSNSVFLNSSYLRLFTAVCVLIIGFVFLSLSNIRSTGRRSEFRRKINSFLQNEINLLSTVGFSFFIVIIMIFILTRRTAIFGDLKIIYLRIEPILVWITVIFAQTGFLSFVLYSIFYIKYPFSLKFEESLKEIGSILIIFLLYTAIKLLVINSYAYGLTIAGDEITYFDMADSLYRGFFSISQSHHYPPLYPLSILISMIFKGWEFDVIKLINVILTSSTVFPIYLLSRQFLGKKKSLIITLLTCLHPSHLVIPGHLLSENLFIPLFVWVIYITFSKPKNQKYNLCWNIINGASIGFLYLTRYITLALIPGLLLAWWIKPFFGEQGLIKPGKKKITNFLILIITMIMVFSSWIFLAVKEGLPIKLALGFGVATRTTPEQLTLINLVIYLCLYVCYYLLISAPVLNLLISVLIHLDFKNYRDGFTRLVIQIMLVTSGFFLAVIRHSWRAYYNREIPSKIMGRYLIVFSAIFLILGAIGLERFDRAKYKNKLSFLLTSQLIPLVIIIISYQIIVEGNIINTGKYLLNPQGSVDGYMIKLLGSNFWILIGFMYSVTNSFLWFRKAKLALLPFYIGLFLYFASVIPAYSKTLLDLQTYPWLAYQISKQIKSQNTNLGINNNFTFYLPENATLRNKTEFLHGLRIRGIENFKIEVYSPGKNNELEIENGLIINKIDEIELLYDSDIQYYEFNNEYYTFQNIIQ